MVRTRSGKDTTASKPVTAYDICTYLLDNYVDHCVRLGWCTEGPPFVVGEGKWTLADLFIRQYLNNGGDGFGCNNTEKVYSYLVKHKDELIAHNLITKDGWNNWGYRLWKDYDFGFDKQV